MGLTILGTPPQILRYQETYETVRQVVDENGGEMQYTDVAEFLVRQMVDKFHTTDLLLMQVNLSFFVPYLPLSGCHGCCKWKCARKSVEKSCVLFRTCHTRSQVVSFSFQQNVSLCAQEVLFSPLGISATLVAAVCRNS